MSGIQIARDERTIEYIREWEKGTGFEKISRKAIASASAIGFITMPHYDSMNYLNGGRSVQRMWLAANQKGISIHPILVPVMFFTRLIHGSGKGLPKNMQEELKK